ncbi:hypothetical protein BO79DRAFT_31220 [Aspergillus costaricaensis CBS 115574]|uniref:Uncharacterized protein n=1 Tax=Aspergillus costaricaensis CBS 115574 TaxID=1448317 RepID=A0ACD1IAU7_9EURO|nr:hypothetical protein BO79DRAFT_31220 [Aspergillus costaricaensis CBS 115574]RAK87473.1 hypothetical protein BO79DRAFT_31220 [Aspergillus costaricaensis CBS 115574]
MGADIKTKVTTGSEMGTDGYLASSVSFFVFFFPLFSLFEFQFSISYFGSLCSRLACCELQRKKNQKKNHQGGQFEVLNWHRSHLIILFVCLFICSRYRHHLSLSLRLFRFSFFFAIFLFHHRRTHPRFASSA